MYRPSQETQKAEREKRKRYERVLRKVPNNVEAHKLLGISVRSVQRFRRQMEERK